VNWKTTKNSKILISIIYLSQEKKTFSSFTIPELPDGEQLVLNLKSTWGDRHYIGLNGIEIFSSEGYPVMIRKVSESKFYFKIQQKLSHHRSPQIQQI
jgi:hypothetical protein